MNDVAISVIEDYREAPRKDDLPMRDVLRDESEIMAMANNNGRNRRRFICDVCGKRFRSRNDLRRHNREHTEDHTKCNACEKAFKQLSHLNSHQITHGGETSYECNECDKEFSSRNRLKDDNRTHSDEKPHEYHTCGIAFRQYGNPKKHEFETTHESAWKFENSKSYLEDKYIINKTNNFICHVINYCTVMV
ncbi:unnamed protein product [Acanthocheilonema viteae]|uniref:C2H2-type domain-containing protein n=1 Tax=Acanthocheilonema viteae TaxID=6277 RepID=A0A498SU15_ACAVI|nr:unnamed protein product [Acanthocheilonema viteae]